MKWLSRLFKRSGGPNQGRPSRYPQFLGDENTVWHAPTTSAVTVPIRFIVIHLFCFIFTAFVRFSLTIILPLFPQAPGIGITVSGATLSTNSS